MSNFNTAAFILQSMEVEQNEQAVKTGLGAAIKLYYENSEDATDIDGDFFRALRTILEGALWNADDDDVIELLTEVEQNITATTGRKFVERNLEEDED